jgi:hypothetical protein
VYSAVGIAIAAVARPKPFWRSFRWSLLMWVLFTLAFAEEPRSLLRVGSWPSDEWLRNRGRRSLRVVSLNCAGGDPAAAAEVAELRPDITLLQESPNSRELAALAKKLYGDRAVAVPGPDGSILAPGPVEILPIPPATGDFVAAIVRMPNGSECTVVSLRLIPPTLRFDYWNPGCWSEYAENLRMRRAQLAAISHWIQVRRRGALIVGGDFNAGPTPTLAGVLPRDLQDTFRAAGAGWGHTAVNDYPLVRIDQIWVSKEFRVERAYVRKTQNSDHRMAIADLTIN